MEEEILAFFDDMDPSGANTERMKSLFATFKTDKEFYRYMKRYFEDPDHYWPVSYKPYDNPVNMEFVHNLAKKHGIPLYEIVYMPYLGPDPDDPPGTVNPIMVIDYPIKRLKQMVYKKSHTSLSTAKRNSETGQVTDQDKTARVTDNEVYSLIVQGQYDSAKEFFGLRADDLVAQNEAQRKIVRDGYLSLKDVDDDPLNKVTMNTMNYYILGSCLVTNLLSKDGYMLPITIKGKAKESHKIRRSEV